MNVYDLPVHPSAELFPMIDDEELAELAADIAENGLRHPIVLGPSPDGEVWLVDGRNRREACWRAAIAEPETVMLNGEDQDAYIISENIKRRHMTKGQRAMAVAKIYPDARPGRGNIDAGGKAAEIAAFSSRRLRQARMVLRYAPDMADGVMKGSHTIDFAYEQAKKRKQDASSSEARLDALRERYPELATKVVEGEMSLDAMEAEATDRDKTFRNEQEGCELIMRQFIDGALGLPDALEKYARAAPADEMSAALQAASRALAKLAEDDSE